MLLAAVVRAEAPLRTSLLSSIIERFITLSVHPVRICEGQVSIFTMSGGEFVSPVPESELERTASLSTVAEWILLGAMGGFLSVAGSEAVT